MFNHLVKLTASRPTVSNAREYGSQAFFWWRRLANGGKIRFPEINVWRTIMGFSPTRRAVIVLVACFTVVWRASIDRDVAAQGRKPVVITRIFTGPDSLAHAE